MTATHARRVATDSWTLRTLREAKAVRDASGEPDAFWDAYLAECEAAVAALGMTRDEDTTAPAAPRTSGGTGMVGGSGTRNAPTEKQVAFLASLHRELGTDAPTARDRSHASLLIDAAKKAVDAARRSPSAAPTARPVRKATERQVEFLADLLNERAHDLGDLDPAELSAARASELIGQLLDAPRAKVAAHGIREGRYAYTTDGGATADHYRVRRDGKIVVWTAGGEWPYTGKGLNEALTWIKANPREAAELFGQLTESCGRCGRELSDDDSRARGLGPVCAGKSDW